MDPGSLQLLAGHGALANQTSPSAPAFLEVSETTQSTASSQVELSNLADSMPASNRQFDRCNSHSATSSPSSSTINLHQMGAVVGSSDGSLSWIRSPGFEAFEVEEQATEVKYLKQALGKKVGSSST